MRGWSGIVDFPHLNDHTEELALVVGAAIEQIQGLSVLVSEIPRDPDHDVCVITGRVGEQLAEMRVVGRLQLILNGRPRSRARMSNESADRRFRIAVQAQPQGLSKL